MLAEKWHETRMARYIPFGFTKCEKRCGVLSTVWSQNAFIWHALYAHSQRTMGKRDRKNKKEQLSSIASMSRIDVFLYQTEYIHNKYNF